MQVLSFVMAAMVFAMWGFSIFRTIIAVRNRAVVRTGKSLPGQTDTLREWGLWLRDPALKKERRQLAFMTICVLGLAAVLAFSSPQAL